MNWKKLIADIQKWRGMTQAQIGTACGTTQSTISSLINRVDGEPSYSLGVKLRDLHEESRPRRKPRKTLEAS